MRWNLSDALNNTFANKNIGLKAFAFIDDKSVAQDKCIHGTNITQISLYRKR
jgi:hypothetical protein